MWVGHLVVLALVGAGLAQQCVCDADDIKGYWTGFGNCTSCDVFGAPLDRSITPAGGASCTLKDRCRDITRPLRERTCYGVGVCINSVTQPCNCSVGNNLAGLYCEQCATGWTNWPSCSTPVCVAPLVNSPSCNNHGTCSDAGASVACGVTGFNCVETRLDPICNPVAYDPLRQTCVGVAGGLVSAFTLSPGQTVCGTTTCNYGETCAPDVSPSRARCCQKDLVPCRSRATDAAAAVVCCHPTQVCCEGVCCASSQKCSKIVNRQFTVSSAMVNTRWNPSGGSSILVPGQPGYSGAWGGGAWSDWKMQDGSTSEPWKFCTNEFLGAASTTRVIILPMLLTVAIIISLLLVWQAAGLNSLLVAIPAIGLLLCSIFLFFSVFWVTAIVVSLAALFAIGSGHKGGTAFLVAIIIEVFALAVVVGGLGLGSFFYSGASTPSLFFSLGNPPTAHSTMWSTLASCSSYYDYFFVDVSSVNPYNGVPGNVPYDVDPDLRFRDYCSEGWYTYLGLVADVVIALQIFMLVATGVAYLKGGSGSKNVN